MPNTYDNDDFRQLGPGRRTDADPNDPSPSRDETPKAGPDTDLEDDDEFDDDEDDDLDEDADEEEGVD